MILEITSEFLEQEMKRIGVHPGAIPIFNRKSNIMLLKIFDISTPTANILKQEMLSIGGDVIVHRNSIDCKIDKTDAIFIGTKKHYDILIQKIENHQYFDLPRVIKELKSFFMKEKPKFIFTSWNRILNFEKTLVMGIINVTPDSFYANSRKINAKEILNTTKDMIENGVDIIDVGGQSTRPGSEFVEEEEELKRVIPAVKMIRENFPEVIISVDTFRSKVAEESIKKGADMINDISAFRFDPALLDVVKEYRSPYILMHMKGTPQNMQLNPYYEDVVREISEFFIDKIRLMVEKNIDENKIIIDPGIGFGKRYEDNIEIISRLKEFKSLKKPLLIGASRKSFIGKALGDLPAEERLEGTLGITALCVLNDVDIIRVHDVKENKRVIKILEAIKSIRY
ncbi:MAG: dihydropteroate synthase [Dictyoglomaceae bacterium]|nr:dihydropteroate synthase [Dictyoglomaceae bacterium]